MIVTCIKKEGIGSGSLVIGNDYFCPEICLYTDSLDDVSYRLVVQSAMVDENSGALALYDSYSYNFIVKENQLINMVYSAKPERSSYIIRLKKLQELENAATHINGLWGAYYDGESPELEQNVHDIIEEAAKLENFPVPKIVAL